MLKVCEILGGAPARVAIMVTAALLAACGQKGPLYLPTGEAAANRASLPQTLNPVPPASSPAPAGGSGTGTATPAPQP